MHKKAYLRDGVPGMTMAQQEATLVAAGLDMEMVYRDALSKAAVRRRDPASLVQRATMLAPTGRRGGVELIHVAGLRVLGWSMPDVARALAAAGARGASVLALDTGTVYDASTLDATLLEGLALADEARRKGQTALGRNAAQEAAKVKRDKRRAAAMAAASADWARPAHEVSAAEIAARVGISRRTLHQYLGPRTEAAAKAKRRKDHA